MMKQFIPLASWIALSAVYVIAKGYVSDKISKDANFFLSWKSKAKSILFAFGIVGLLSLISAKNLGKTSECVDYDDEPIYGGCRESKETINFIPTANEQLNHGITYFIIIGIPTALGMWSGYRS